MHWMNEHPDRDRCHEAMRRIGDRIDVLDREYRNLQPPPGTIGVGGAWFDAWVRVETGYEFLRNLRKGMNPQQACDAAKVYGRECVRKFNESRKRDYQTHRHEGTAEPWLDSLQREMEGTAC